ncbi:MAG: hypothetical protein AAGE94_16670 [Acidobacteriota bacterium]
MSSSTLGRLDIQASHRPQRSDRFRAHALRTLGVRLGLCLILVVAWLVDADPVGAVNGNQGVSSFFDADGPITELPIGADLTVHLAGVTPGADYRVRLLDESNAVVDEQILEADGLGLAIAHAPLWERSGVVGCDPGVFTDPSSYLFSDFDQAEAILDGRTFDVEIVELATAEVVDRKELPMTRETASPRYFFADAAGCPRSRFTDLDTIYIAGRNMPRDGAKLTFFLIGSQHPPTAGESLTDVRGGGQSILVGTGTRFFLRTVWSRPVPGYYGGVMRDGLDPNPEYSSGDRWIGASSDFRISPHGITVTSWDCPGCPPDDQTAH